MWLNCDMGESFGAWKMGADEQVMPYIDQANIACGFHASDPLTMQKTVRLAVKHGVMIGAHPGYPDLVGFGRRSMSCSRDEIIALVRYQVGALQAIANAEGGEVSYVKPHGALYNDMMRDDQVLEAVMSAVAALKLPMMGLAMVSNERLEAMAQQTGVVFWPEAFADRAYDEQGLLVSRQLEGAVHHDEACIVEQALALASGSPFANHQGQSLTLQAKTLCVHGDNPTALAAVKAIRQAFNERSAQA